MNRTYFQHYNLYKYILTTPQEQDYTSLVKDVMVPDVAGVLQDGVEESQWRYCRVEMQGAAGWCREAGCGTA